MNSRKRIHTLGTPPSTSILLPRKEVPLHLDDDRDGVVEAWIRYQEIYLPLKERRDLPGRIRCRIFGPQIGKWEKRETDGDKKRCKPVSTPIPNHHKTSERSRECTFGN